MEDVLKIDTKQIAATAGVSINMAFKYKAGYSLPRLDKAILLEDKLGIPARFWLELKNKRSKNVKS